MNIDIENSRKIGEGAYSIAYKKNNYVIKTIGSKADLQIYKIFHNKKHKHIVPVYNIDDNVVITKFCRTNLAKIYYKQLSHLCYDYNGCVSLKYILSDINTARTLTRFKLNGKKNKDFNMFIDDLIGIVDELHSLNMYNEDIHMNNIGYIGKRLVLFDLGCMSKYLVFEKPVNGFIDMFRRLFDKFLIYTINS
jgi:hypothetical protein